MSSDRGFAYGDKSSNEGDRSSMPADQRSGFGLITVRDFVQRAGGTIEVESRVGEGTTFRLLLPRSTSRAAHVM